MNRTSRHVVAAFLSALLLEPLFPAKAAEETVQDTPSTAKPENLSQQQIEWQVHAARKSLLR